MARHGGNVLVELWTLPLLCEVYLKAGGSERAEACLERGFGLLTPDRAWYGLPAPLFVARGMCAAGRQEWAEAMRSFERAVAVGRENRLPYDTAKALYEWGLAHLTRGQSGDRESGRAKLTESLEIFQSIKAVKDVERVTARKELLGT